jgi:hypothetical protein
MITGIKYADSNNNADIIISHAFAHGMEEVLQPIEQWINEEEAWVWLHVEDAGLKVIIEGASEKLRHEIRKLLSGVGYEF